MNDFCQYCGASIPHRYGEGRCDQCDPLRPASDDVVCEHGTAMDVHCCNCHSGFLFDADSCVCATAARDGVADLLAYGEQEKESARVGKDREMYQLWGGWVAALQRLDPASSVSPGVKEQLEKEPVMQLGLAEPVKPNSINPMHWAEGLILQLPETHEGRTSWLMNYSRSEIGERLRTEWLKQNPRSKATFQLEASALASPEREALQKRVEQWRSWAQFVYLKGGPVEGTDGELQTRVCAAQDQELTNERETLELHLKRAEEALTALQTQITALQPYVQHLASCELIRCPSGIVDRDCSDERPTYCTCDLASLVSPAPEEK